MAATLSCCGPVKNADGNISPKSRTSVTLINTAMNSGTRLSRNKGRLSLAMELRSKSVTSRRWCCDMRGNIFAACSRSSGVPLRILIASVSGSMDNIPYLL